MIQIQTCAAYPIIYQFDTSCNQPSQTGAVQWNGTSKRFEVSTGAGWMTIDNTIKISHSSDIDEIIKWAHKKMQEEKKLEKLAVDNISIKDLLNSKKSIEQQISTITTLIS